MTDFNDFKRASTNSIFMISCRLKKNFGPKNSQSSGHCCHQSDFWDHNPEVVAYLLMAKSENKCVCYFSCLRGTCIALQNIIWRKCFLRTIIVAIIESACSVYIRIRPCVLLCNCDNALLKFSHLSLFKAALLCGGRRQLLAENPLRAFSPAANNYSLWLWRAQCN